MANEFREGYIFGDLPYYAESCSPPAAGGSWVGFKGKGLRTQWKGLQLVVHLRFFQDLDIFLTRISFSEIRCLHVLVILIENHGHYNYFMPIGLRSNKGNL